MSGEDPKHVPKYEMDEPSTPPLKPQGGDADVDDLVRLVSTISIREDQPSAGETAPGAHTPLQAQDGEVLRDSQLDAAQQAQMEAKTASPGRGIASPSRPKSLRRAAQDFGANSPDYPPSVHKETSNMTGIFFDERCLLHQANYRHCESPERLAESYKLLVKEGLWSRCVQFRIAGRSYPQPATPEDVPATIKTEGNAQTTPESASPSSGKGVALTANEQVSLAVERFPIDPVQLHPLSFPPVPLLPPEALHRTHDPSHVQRIESSATFEYKEPEPDSETEGDTTLYPDCKFLDSDTYVNQYSAIAARIAATAAVEVTRRVLRGELRNGFSLTRPPGHHAAPQTCSGFCLYNNVAVAAQAALREFPDKCRRIMIIDFDVHHGDGTQACFWDSREVLFVSIHRYGGGFFPGTGTIKQVGGDNAKGYTVNIPFVGVAGDYEYHYAWRRIVLPLLAAHAPHLVLLSAGFDCLVNDPLGEMKVTPLGVGHLVRQVREALPPGCGLVGVLEGGYNPLGVAEGIKWVVKAMLGDELPELPSSDLELSSLSSRDANKLQLMRERHIQTIEQVCDTHKKYWPVLKM